uniref:Elongation of very long chain fatty acids protein n=2 Tax=Lygus hesperus TaxID=30085 RepID=A0A0A9X8R0_LYGHE
MVFGLIRSAIHHHNQLMDTYGDPRVKDWLLMGSPLPTIFLSLAYVFIVKYLGPKLMENRKPFQLRKAIIVYNACMVAFSSWIVYEGVTWGWAAGVSFRCEPCDFSNSPRALRVASCAWWYFFSKLVEFIDTFFFVLRKKNNQISTLHVTHHAIMPIGVWFGASLYPGGQAVFFGILNSFVHVIMYSYYLLAALGPEFKKYLWWKKYLTIIQLVQFVLIFFHTMQLFFIDCAVPILFGYLISGYAALFIALFSRF